MAADALLPVVDAKDDLGLQPLFVAGPASVIVRQCVDQRVSIMVLVGALPHRASHGRGQSVQRRQQALQIGRGQGAQFAASNPEMLGQPKQPPSAAVDRMRIRLCRHRAVQPGPHHVGQGIPSGKRRLPLRQLPRPAGQIFWQSSFVQGVPHQRLRRSLAQISPQRRQRAFHVPDFPTLALDPQTVEAQPHRQVVHQRNPIFAAGRIVGVLLPPVHHPGPAGQFQGQPGQIAFPARFGETQPPQFGDHRIDRIVRPTSQHFPPAR